MTYFRKRPVVIEARRWDGSALGATPIVDWVLGCGASARYRDESDPRGGPALAIDTLEGTITASAGDWVIRGVKGGEFYPCKPGIFDATYEPVDKPDDVLASS